LGSTKLQMPNKRQKTNDKTAPIAVRRFGFVWNLELGIWDLPRVAVAPARHGPLYGVGREVLQNGITGSEMIEYRLAGLPGKARSLCELACVSAWH